jgi:hypothetical protein
MGCLIVIFPCSENGSLPKIDSPSKPLRLIFLVPKLCLGTQISNEAPLRYFRRTVLEPPAHPSLPGKFDGQLHQIIHGLGGKEGLTEKLFDACPEAFPAGGLLGPHKKIIAGKAPLINWNYF